MQFVVLQGDGIGPEIVSSAIDIINLIKNKLKIKIDLIHLEIGFSSLKSQGTTFPKKVLEICKKSDGIILGPVDHNNYPSEKDGGLNPSGLLRSHLDLYSNIRPAKTYNNLKSTVDLMDLIIVRENTEGFYADRNMYVGNGEFLPEPGIGIALRKITDKGSKRIALRAFEIASNLQKNKSKINVHAIHKANVMKLTDGIFLDACREVSKSFPEINYSEMIVDAAAAHLVRNPTQFDVLVTTNMFGDILSDLASELSGSLGLAGSINVGDRIPMAQAQHGSAPDIAGKGMANPISMILSVGMMFGWLGIKKNNDVFIKANDFLHQAIDEHLMEQHCLTPDLGGKATTQEVTSSILTKLDLLF